MSTKKIKGRV